MLRIHPSSIQHPASSIQMHQNRLKTAPSIYPPEPPYKTSVSKMSIHIIFRCIQHTSTCSRNCYSIEIEPTPTRNHRPQRKLCSPSQTTKDAYQIATISIQVQPVQEDESLGSPAARDMLTSSTYHLLPWLSKLLAIPSANPLLIWLRT
jgi:hypothetical protein